MGKGLRRSSRLNPELKNAEDMVAMLTTIMNNQTDEETIKGEILAFSGNAKDGDSLLDNPMAFKASADPDIMYMHEAMREKDNTKICQGHGERSS